MPVWTAETEALIVAALVAHHLDISQLDADRNSPCVCGGWREDPMGRGWDEHMAEVVLAALADAGLLVTRTCNHHGWYGLYCARLVGHVGRHAVDKIRWPLDTPEFEGDTNTGGPE